MTTRIENGWSIRYAFFDFAGTLVDGVPNWEFPQILACRELGIQVTPPQVKSAIWQVWGPLEGCRHPEASASEASYRRWIAAVERRILEGLGVPGTQLEHAAGRVMDLQVSPECYRVFPDVPDALTRLRGAGYRLGLISNFAWRLSDLVEKLGLGELLDLVVTSARVGYRKPRPEIFAQALAQLGAEPAESLFVGDDPVCDWDGARAAGLTPLLLDRRQRTSLTSGRIRTLQRLPGLLMGTKGAIIGQAKGG